MRVEYSFGRSNSRAVVPQGGSITVTDGLGTVGPMTLNVPGIWTLTLFDPTSGLKSLFTLNVTGALDMGG